MFAFLAGLALGAAALGWLYYRERRRRSDATERALLLQQEKLIVVDFMHHMLQAMGEGLNKEELFQRIVHAAIVSTGALSACVFEKTAAGTLKGVAVEGLFPPHRPLPESLRARVATRARFLESVLKSEEFPVGEGVIGQVALTRRAELIADGRRDPRIVKHGDPALEVTTAICAPIVFREELLGVLAVCNSADGLPFTSTDFSVVQSLAEQAGMAIHNNEFLTLQVERKQIDVDLALARSIQLMLLPQRLPEIEGLEMAARYVSSHSIGGDLYDVIGIGPRSFGLAVADVSGKGIPGSIVMAICRTNLRRLAVGERSPAEALKKLNRSMVGEMQEGMYITMLYAIVDLDRDQIVYARAGHERPLLCAEDRQSGVARALFPESEGMPLGLVDGAFFDGVIEEKTLPFLPGDVFVAFTDGLTEATNGNGKEFSASRLADAAKTLRKRAADEIASGIIESLERFTGRSRTEDDLTLVTVKRLAPRAAPNAG